MPFGIPSQKGEYIERCFWHSLYLFFVLGGDFIFFDWLELVELFRLYLGASLCIFTFLALATLSLLCWVIHVRGSIFLWFLFQTSYWFMIMSSSLLYVFIVCV